MIGWSRCRAASAGPSWRSACRSVLPPDELLVVANTGDDFEHLGLTICPDIDTLTYMLAGLDNPELGWGRRDETWSFMETLARLGRRRLVPPRRPRPRPACRAHAPAHGGETLSPITGRYLAPLGIGPRSCR